MNYGIWVLTFGEVRRAKQGNPFHPDTIIPCEALFKSFVSPAFYSFSIHRATGFSCVQRNKDN